MMAGFETADLRASQVWLEQTGGEVTRNSGALIGGFLYNEDAVLEVTTENAEPQLALRKAASSDTTFKPVTFTVNSDSDL